MKRLRSCFSPMVQAKTVLRKCIALTALCLWPLWAGAETFRLPPSGNDLVGEIRYVKARHEDTLIDIAREFSVGQDEIIMANPAVDRWLPGDGTEVLIPRRFILPDAPRNGLVLNIPEMRLYYFPAKTVVKKVPKTVQVTTGTGKARKTTQKVVETEVETTVPAGEVVTYPVSIGRMDWRTPLGATRVVEKLIDPVWRPPASIKEEHARDGDMLPDVVPAGPMNPLGKYAMRLGVAGYLIHGTGIDKAYGIGMRVTHGCIRMYPEDIERLFPKVGVGTPVYLVNQPVKLGWMGAALVSEVHQPLDEDRMDYDSLLTTALDLVEKQRSARPFILDGAALRKALQEPSGIPVRISKAPTLEALDEI